MKDPTSLGFIGGGRVARIILGGFRKKGKEFAETVVSDTEHDGLSRLREKSPGIRA